MKQFSFFILCFLAVISFLISEKAQSQNVGIGTTTPQATLDVKGNQRIGGLSSYVTFDSATGRIEWKNSNLYVPVSQALVKHSAAGDGLFYNNTAPTSGQLEYRNALGEPVFYSNFTNGNGYFKNFLGIGTTTPITNLQIESNNNFPLIVNGASNLFISWAENNNYRGYLGSFAGNPEDIDFGTYFGNNGKIHFTTANIPRVTIDAPGNMGIGTVNPTNPLSFPPVLSKKISLYPGASGDAGLGVSGNLLKIYADHPNADVAFGYDDYVNGFIERMRVRGNGNVGIGQTNPSEKLQVSGNIKADSFKYSTPKTFFYNLSGSDFRGFLSRDTTTISLGSGGIFMGNTAVTNGIVAPVHLPHGAKMINITYYLEDFSAAQNLQTVFYRKTILSNFFPDNIGVVNSAGSAGLAAYTTPVNFFSNIVDNTLYTYYLNVYTTPFPSAWSSSALGLRAVIIEYTLSEAQ
jgi:hypothetical protein